MQKLKRRWPRIAAILLSMMMVVVFIPTFAFAADAGTITVYLTVNNAGKLAAAKDGSVMASKEVTVKDADGDGHFTFDEALAAAHDAYYEGGAAAGYDPGTGMAKTVWGVTNGGNYLFFTNDKGLQTGITVDTVSNGDYLTASINADTVYYTDWYSTFDAKKKTVFQNESVKLTLKGHLGMAWTEEAKKDVPLPNMTVKDATGATLGTTDNNGEVTLPFKESGTHIITAEGVVKDVQASAYGMKAGEDEKGSYCCDYEGSYLYTEADHGMGPYPVDEIKTIPVDVYTEWYYDDDDEYDPDLFEAELAKYHLVYADFVGEGYVTYPILVDAPIMAPACVVTVVKDIAGAQITVDNATYTGKTLTPAVKVAMDGKNLTAGTDYTVAYSNNTNAGKGTVALTGIGEYGGSASQTFTIAKAKQPMKVTAKGKTFKVKKLKKAKKSYQAVKVTKNKGKVSYKVTYKNKKSKKALSFKNGKVTVKKKTKKGTYQLTVKVTAKGNANYNAGTITKKIKIKVK